MYRCNSLGEEAQGEMRDLCRREAAERCRDGASVLTLVISDLFIIFSCMARVACVHFNAQNHIIAEVPCAG